MFGYMERETMEYSEHKVIYVQEEGVFGILLEYSNYDVLVFYKDGEKEEIYGEKGEFS